MKAEELKEFLPSEGTIKAVAWATIALAGIWYISRFKEFHAAGSGMLKPVADGISQVFDKVRFAGERVEQNYQGVILRPKDFENGAIKPLALQAATQMGEQNAQILQFVLGPGGTLREPYKTALQHNEIILVLPDGSIDSGQPGQTTQPYTRETWS